MTPDTSSGAPESPDESAPLTELTTESAGLLHPKDSVQTAADKMRELDTTNWPVAEDRKLVGMIDARNPDREIAAHGHDPKSWRVAEVMNKDTVFCFEDQSANEAWRVMEERGLEFLPVLDREMRIVGVLSRPQVEQARVQPSGGTDPVRRS